MVNVSNSGLNLRRIATLVLAAAVLAVPAAAQEATAPEEHPGVLEGFDAWVGEYVVAPLEKFLFMKIGLGPVVDAAGHDIQRSLPLIVVVLFIGGIFFTARYGLVNVRLFRHSIDCIRGKYDRPEDAGEVSHFQALTSALSATVGLGNIAGVAIAISMGGAGAVFWMWLTAFLGMSMKFSSCTFAHIHRHIHEDGRVLGGPMVYLSQGIRERWPSLAPLAKTFAVVFAVLTIFSAFGGGNMYQGNQTASIFNLLFFDGGGGALVKLSMGLVLAALVGVVLIGGIRRIGEITSKLVPGMCVFYCGICLVIVLLNAPAIPGLFADIFAKAFSGEAVFGGFIGVLFQGMRRAAFSNEAGVGSAAIAHAAAKTKEPVREGVVAMLGPFIDTIIVCTMTALTILITDAHLEEGLEGVEITAHAFAQLGPVVPYVLSLAVFVFAYSTMISWGYYGERATEYLFGVRAIRPYRVVYVMVVVLGPVLSLGNVLTFSDMMLLSMAFPNIIGMMLISGKVRLMTQDYVRRLKSGEMQPVR